MYPGTGTRTHARTAVFGSSSQSSAVRDVSRVSEDPDSNDAAERVVRGHPTTGGYLNLVGTCTAVLQCP